MQYSLCIIADCSVSATAGSPNTDGSVASNKVLRNVVVVNLPKTCLMPSFGALKKAVCYTLLYLFEQGLIC